MKMKSIHSILTVGLLLSMTGPIRAQVELSNRIEFFEERLDSADWNVRYCLLSSLDGGTQEEKVVLERLISDKHPKVRNQAMRRYVNNYLDIDRALVRRYFEDFYMVPDGMFFIDKPDIQSIEFHKSVLHETFSPRCAQSIECIGILGDKVDAPTILPFLKGSNPYLLNTAAASLYRLGDRASALKCFANTLGLTAKTSGGVYHQIQAIRYLSQIDLELAREKYAELKIILSKRDDLYPRTINEFTLLGFRLKQVTGTKEKCEQSVAPYDAPRRVAGDP